MAQKPEKRIVPWDIFQNIPEHEGHPHLVTPEEQTPAPAHVTQS